MMSARHKMKKLIPDSRKASNWHAKVAIDSHDAEMQFYV